MNFRKFVYSVRNLTFPCPDDNLYTRKLGNGGKKKIISEKKIGKKLGTYVQV